jgi:hypothetical protein
VANFLTFVTDWGKQLAKPGNAKKDGKAILSTLEIYNMNRMHRPI